MKEGAAFDKLRPNGFVCLIMHMLTATPMTEYKSTLLRLLSERGYIHQVTDAAALDALAVKQLVPGYIVGGGTSKIGDPSFKDEARKLLTAETINANIASIRRVFEHFLTFGDGPTDAMMVDNSDWLDKLEYIPFLREVGQHFSVNRMLGFDSVKLRLEREQSLSFLEFNYMILQAYDFRELANRAGCRLQLGGSDQWGNIVNGIELTRRMDGIEVFGVTTPLITTADGGKMGKTERGAVWLNADQLPPYDYWQFWRNTQDADVGKFLRLFTDLPLDEIARLETLEDAEINEAKKALADAATAMLHGAEAAAAANETARRTFEEGVSDANLPTVNAGTVIEAVVGLGFAASNKEVRRKITEGAIRLNDEKVDDPQAAVKSGDKVSFGAKKHGLIG
jgi:tyrosyl-tRNA synthetase